MHFGTERNGMVDILGILPGACKRVCQVAHKAQRKQFVSGLTLGSVLASLDRLAFMPQGTLCVPILGGVVAHARLLAVLPEALILSSIWPCENAEALLLVKLIAPSVLAAAGPSIPSDAVEDRLLPLA